MKVVKIEVILLKIQVLQSVNFLFFSLYFTHCFVHHFKMNPGRQDVPFVVPGHIWVIFRNTVDINLKYHCIFVFSDSAPSVVQSSSSTGDLKTVVTYNPSGGVSTSIASPGNNPRVKEAHQVAYDPTGDLVSICFELL